MIDRIEGELNGKRYSAKLSDPSVAMPHEVVAGQVTYAILYDGPRPARLTVQAAIREHELRASIEQLLGRVAGAKPKAPAKAKSAKPKRKPVVD
jgi:hypothetical protein